MGSNEKIQKKKKINVQKRKVFKSVGTLLLCFALTSGNVFASNVVVGTDESEVKSETKQSAVKETGQELTDENEVDLQEQELEKERARQEDISAGSEQEQETTEKESTEEPSETMEEIQTEAAAIVKLPQTKAGETLVGDWDTFVLALQDTSASHIVLTGDIARGSSSSNPGTISRDLIIDGDGHSINFGSGGGSSNGILLGTVSIATTLTVMNISLTKTTEPTVNIFDTSSGTNWNINLENVKTNQGQTGNCAGLIDATEAFVKVYGTESNLILNGRSYQMNIKDFEMTAGAKLTAVSGGASWAVLRVTNGDVTLRENSQLDIENYGSLDGEGDTEPQYSHGIYGLINNLVMEAKSKLDIGTTAVSYRTRGAVTYFKMGGGAVFNARSVGQSGISIAEDYSSNPSTQAILDIDGEGTTINVECESDRTANYGAAFRVGGDGCVFNLTNGAKIYSHHTENSAFQMLGEGNVFNVKSGSVLEAVQDGGTYTLGSTIRFRLTGGQTFNINGGTVKIHKKGGYVSALRMFGGNNAINVTNRGKLEILNEGGASFRDGSGSTGNQGIHYTDGDDDKPDSFNLDGEGSTVDIEALTGPAIYTSNRSDIIVKNQANFIAAGRTPNKTDAIIRSGSYTNIVLDNPAFFDMRNNRPGGGYVVASGNGDSTFDAINSDLSVWTHESNLDGTPTNSWSLVGFQLKGETFEKIQTTPAPPPDFLGKDENDVVHPERAYGGAELYSRMSANNGTAVVDSLRVPTNADKHIYGHVTVPEGVDGSRDAWTDEVHVYVNVYDKDNNLIYKNLKGHTVGIASDGSNAGLSVYGEPEKGGILVIDVPDDKYLETGMRVEVVSAWRGIDNLSANPPRYHMSAPEDLKAADVTVQDVIPPKALTSTNIDSTVLMYQGDLTTRTTGISGTSDQPSGTAVYLYRNNLKEKQTTIGANGEWSFTFDTPLTETDKIAVALNDNVPNATNLTTYDIDKLNNNGVYANGGNENPPVDYNFHDASFTGRLAFDVVYYGALDLTISEDISYGTNNIAPGQTSYKADPIELNVEDTRKVREEWLLTAQLTTPFTLEGDTDTLDVDLVYAYEGEEKVIGNTATNIWKHTNQTDIFDIKDQWGIGPNADDNGLFVKANAGDVRTGSYQATVTWVLSDAP